MGEDLEKSIGKVINGTTSKTGIALKLLAQMVDTKFKEQESESKRMHDETISGIKNINSRLDDLSVISFFSTHKKLFIIIVVAVIVITGSGIQNIISLLSKL
jgi:hypothetical protein